MSHHQHDSTTSAMLTFPALQSWLGKELEVRGIDAVIYTRYILSILQQDHFEVEADDDPDLPLPHRKEAVHHHHHHHQQRQGGLSGKSGGGGGGKRQHQKRRRSSWTAEDLKKNAVLECLHSVTTGEVGLIMLFSLPL